MKIKVVTVKDICKYLVRIGIVFAVVVIFANFFYSNRNITSCISLDSTKLLGVIKEEILLLKNESEINLGSFSKADYSKQTFNSEISMFKAVANNNMENEVLVNNVENGNLNSNVNNNENSNMNNNQNGNVQDENSIDNKNNSEDVNSNSGLQEARNRFTC